MSGKAVIVWASGEFEVVDLAAEPVDLAWMQKTVGGYVQCVATAKFDVWCDEEGWLKQSAGLNPYATGLLKLSMLAHRIAGTALLLGRDAEGDCRPLSESVAAELSGTLTRMGATELVQT